MVEPEQPAALAAESAMEFGRWLFAQECRFAAAAGKPDQIPELGLPEVAFAGRSNVGKSSLVNALTGRRTLARTSQTPGRTRQIVFFVLGERLGLVDLPGYGFARAAKGEIRQWSGLTRDFLRGRPTLQRVCLLIDARHGPKESDRDIMAILDAAAVSYQAVLTKADKTRPGELTATRDALSDVLARRPAGHPEILVTSALDGSGIAELRAALATLAAPAAGGSVSA